MPFRVTSIRRYPVKSMGGEALDLVHLDARGLAGDRWFAVRDADDRLASGKDTRRFRRHDEVFAFAARTRGFTVEVDGDGHTWVVGDPGLDAHLSERMGLGVSVRPEKDIPHQDAGSVSLVGTATLEHCAREWGIDADPRRLRVNLVLETQVPFVEKAWIGRDLAIGTARLTVRESITRCRMIDVDQDGATTGDHWLAALGREGAPELGVYADVVAPGAITVGDKVSLARPRR